MRLDRDDTFAATHKLDVRVHDDGTIQIGLWLIKDNF